MSMLTDEQAALLDHLDACTHEVFRRDYVEKSAALFGCEIRSRPYADFGYQVGLSAREFVEGLCNHFGVAYERKFGRGSQVLACTHALREHFASTPVPMPVRPWHGPLSRKQPPRACKTIV